ncbi:SMP-30/Gluconolaconase/LRE-like region [Colletotrichum graminicola]|uniref:SMP-30/Gluconolaconase/LRE-like region n=1 Tax=Colletotrichum graminicola (strain M1.001 / M2 / FGSC 10212) TaxID=645133 RepID=E3Q820_COLGM|nr:SMP-30/Gluconolaconase/LRE-like region [Colletotrichum graminicola M1.001]EFQ27032.1 SMP-30/Gluconolaconase/LRE-like region [Colletotrichum graminicola M1.001]WDK16773.1 SMP-30/Gluconolaconase/LRE-like region [Colletotrichum graminicola]
MAPLQTWTAEKPYLNLHCGLGEGPYYEKAANVLRFVDIKKKQIHFVNLDQGPESLRTVQLDVPVGVTAGIAGVDPKNKILVGLKYGIAVLDVQSGTYQYVSKLHDTDNERLRANDGAVDPHGRFWLGTMTDFGLGDFQAEGALHRFDGASGKEEVVRDLLIPNSVGWSPDNRTMYFTHSTDRKVYAWDYSPADGALSGKRVFYAHDGPGEPDGFRVDAEGNLWHAVYNEGRVLKISPAGELVGEVRVPTLATTCVQFVGTELFITTAQLGEAEGTEEQRELGGALFRVDVGARGLEPFEFKL